MIPVPTLKRATIQDSRLAALWHRIPRQAVVRLLILVLLIIAAGAAARWTPLGRYLDREVLQATLNGLRDVWWAPLLLIASFILFCNVGLPATPFLVVGGLVFGLARGTLYSFIGLFSSAILGYVVARFLATDFFRHLLGSRLRKIEKQVARRGFWYLIGLRLLPIPFPISNFGLALAGVPLSTYALTSALGLAPATLLWTWFAVPIGKAATAAPGEGQMGSLALRLAGISALLAVLILLPAVVSGRNRRRRLRDLQAQRALRS